MENAGAESVDAELLSRLPKSFLLSGPVAPLRREGDRIVVAAPEDAVSRAAEAAMLLGGRLAHTPLDAEAVRALVARHHGTGAGRAKLVAEAAAGAAAEEEDLRELANDAPVVRLVSDLFQEAVSSRASDVHISPEEDRTRVAFRIDGVLREAETLPPNLHPAVISRIKVLARLNIAERRLPQDGRFEIAPDPARPARRLDVRVSILPTAFGERAVLRLLDPARADLGIEDLGLTEPRLSAFRRALRAPFGLILSTGPTGSGKTTTLYGSLREIHDGSRNILTVEDPVEYHIEGISQTQVRPEIGLTFAAGLRSILRQDPDIVMVGEIRDAETAKIAVQAALTGHLVLSTLHTNDAPSAAARLIDMGVEPYLLASVLRAVLAQRLVRVLCPTCKVPAQGDAESARLLGLAPTEAVFGPGGCDACRGIGYLGRTGLFELMLADERVRELIHAEAPADELRQAAERAGMTTLLEDGREKVRDGVTSVEEVLRAASA